MSHGLPNAAKTQQADADFPDDDAACDAHAHTLPFSIHATWEREWLPIADAIGLVLSPPVSGRN